MFTLTVKIAAAGAKIKDDKPSIAGHMWLSVYGNGQTSSMGFGPVKHGDPSGPGGKPTRITINIWIYIIRARYILPKISIIL